MLALADHEISRFPSKERPHMPVSKTTPGRLGRELEFQGEGIVEAALQACRLRLRPIVMTSVAFIAGTIPLVLSGAGAEVRSATGVAVFAGMIGVTLFGLFLTPVFYVGLRKLSGRKLIQHSEASLSHG